MRNLIFALVLGTPIVVASAGADVPKVVTDIAPIHGLVSMVLGERGTPDMILPPNASPHEYAMRPSDARALGQADLVIWVGTALTPWLAGPLDTLAPAALRIELMNVPGTKVLGLREAGVFDPHGHGDDEGHQDNDDDSSAKDQGGMRDPHMWLDPDNAVLWLKEIAGQLSALDPEGADGYRANALMAAGAIRAGADRIHLDLSGVKDRPFVVLHDGFLYFETYFGLTSVAAVKSAEADQPGPARMSQIRATLRDSGVVCAFSEPQIDSGLLDTATDGLDIGRGIIDPIGVNLPLGEDHYLALMASISDSVKRCLSR